VDVTEDLFVNETPLLARGVSMSKGCYPGQESVARIHNLGRIRRSLRSLRSDGGSLAAGVDVELGGAVVGRVTSAARAPDGIAVGIALLASEVEPGARVRIDGTEALVGSLP
jgi:folate-binding protein YgfZ